MECAISELWSIDDVIASNPSAAHNLHPHRPLSSKPRLTRLLYTRPRLRLAIGIRDCAKHKDGIRVGARRVAAHAVLWQQHLATAHQQHLTDGRDAVLLLDLLLQVLDTVERRDRKLFSLTVIDTASFGKLN